MSKSTAEIRQLFLDFFHSKGHEIVPSSSLVPQNDPTLLFTNAGMNQFKNVFLGYEKRSYVRATTAQRCVRAGGKHNDLENVGYTARHHTFFEMLGNFSFGDYFKEDAIRYAWELLTDKNWLAIPKEKLWITIYESDEGTYKIWTEQIGVPKERIIRIGDNKGAPYASDNFWQMGDTGPCGPCTEIFYDHGEHIPGGLPGTPEEDGDRYIEIWNIVFMQFNRQPDGSMHPLPKPSVDTGMGLERIAAVLQHVNSNYGIDLFQKLIRDTAQVLNVTSLEHRSLFVIADHIRSCTFLIADGVKPSNEGRGYVLRRIIRRAIRHGNKLGAKEAFFYKLVSPVIDVMESAAESIVSKCSEIEMILKQEEEQFIRTLERGLVLLDDALATLKGNILSGDVAFKLYDTYGFPVDLTSDICNEKGVIIDEVGFEQEMEQQRKRARETNQFSANYNTIINSDETSEFTGYETLVQKSTLKDVYCQGEKVDTLKVGDEAILIVEETPFYAESGGQMSDFGLIKTVQGEFEVTSVQKYGLAIGHQGKVISGSFNINDEVELIVDTENRNDTQRNHSATHLLHAALRSVLGKQVEQKGSLVNADYLRFDFSYPEALTKEQLSKIQNLVNQEIRNNLPVVTEIMDLDNAKKKGAMALFDEKYAENVRVLLMGDFSIELCGGTHVDRTGDIGLFRIFSESGIAAGIRRIEAVTGKKALELIDNEHSTLTTICTMLKSDKQNVVDKLHQLQDQNKKLEKDLQSIKERLSSQEAKKLLDDIIKINGINILVSELKNGDAQRLRQIWDNLKNELSCAVVVLSVVNEGKISFIVGVTNELSKDFHAGNIIKELAEKVGGKGGGRPDMAQAGGTNVDALSSAMSDIRKLLITRSEKLLY